MLRIRTGARRGLRCSLFGFASVVALLALSIIPADAAPYAAIVVDGNSGAILHSSNPDARRHPASLTKIMTLYLLFEQLEAGKLKLDSQLKVSEHAAGQSPTKLGLKAGSTIQVEEAIKGIIIRSANDASVVVAEAIAGDEEDFAELMTKKAQALGMTRTVYKNASGLPDDDQVTTARDQSILGRAIQERFPRYYKYFSTRSFTFQGKWISSHNRLLGRVEGVDGIKTGYIRASGFNLVTSVKRGNRHVVAVVIGGTSASSRDERMRELIADHIAKASTKRTAPMIAEAPPKAEKVAAKGERKPEPKVADKPESKAEPRYAVASAGSLSARSPVPKPEVVATRVEPAAGSGPAVVTGSTEPIRPILVKTLTVRAGPQTASLAPLHFPSPAPAALAAAPAKPEPPAKADGPPAPPLAVPAAPAVAANNVAAKVEPPTKADVPLPQRSPRVGVHTVLPARTADAAPASPPAPAVAAGPPPAPTVAAAPAVAVAPTLAPTVAAAPPPMPAVAAAPPRAPAVAAAPPPAPAPAPVLAVAAAPPPAPTVVAPAKPRVGWSIQVGAFPDEEVARQRLNSVQNKAAKVLAGNDPYTESVLKGGTTYYRARFAGFDQDKAEAACKYLKRNDVECISVKN
jgi:D-alanyl-D-alanine carboxypeptidase